MKPETTAAPEAGKQHDVAHLAVLIPLDQITPSRHQNRGFTKKPDQALRDLATSIDTQGVIEPIIVRAVDDLDTPYELVAGERRWRASKLAKKGTVPSIIRHLTEAEAAEMTVTENVQREDLTPMEEATGVETMLGLYAGDIEIVADRLRVHPGWVARRARLTKLSPSWVDAARDQDSVVSAWGATLLEVIARVAVEEQEDIYESMQYRLPVNPSVKDLEGTVARGLRKLSSALWELFDDELLDDRPACLTCSDRTSQAPLLFEDLKGANQEGKGDRCTNGPCWGRKVQATVKRKVADLPRDAIRITSQYFHADEKTPPLAKGAVRGYEVRKLAKKHGGVPCIWVDGADAGKTFYGKRVSKITGEISEAPRVKTLSERRAELVRKRWKRTADQVAYLLYPQRPAGKKGDDWEAPAPRTLDEIPSLKTLTIIAASVGTILKLDSPTMEWNRWSTEDDEGAAGHSSISREMIQRAQGKQPKKGDPDLAEVWARMDIYRQNETPLRRDLWNQIAPVLAGRCRHWSDLPVGRGWSELERICELVGDNLKARYDAVVAATPEPKVWATLNPDGSKKKTAKSRKTGGGS